MKKSQETLVAEFIGATKQFAETAKTMPMKWIPVCNVA